MSRFFNIAWENYKMTQFSQDLDLLSLSQYEWVWLKGLHTYLLNHMIAGIEGGLSLNTPSNKANSLIFTRCLCLFSIRFEIRFETLTPTQRGQSILTSNLLKSYSSLNIHVSYLLRIPLLTLFLFLVPTTLCRLFTELVIFPSLKPGTVHHWYAQ